MAHAHHFVLLAVTQASAANTPVSASTDTSTAWIGFWGTVIAAVIGAVVLVIKGKEKSLSAAVDTQREAERTAAQLRTEVERLKGLRAGQPSEFTTVFAALTEFVLYRRRYVIELAFETSPVADSMVVNRTTKYTLVNCGNAVVVHQIRVNMVPEAADKDTRMVRIAGLGPDLGAHAFDIGYPAHMPPALTVAHDIEIPQNNQRPGNEITIETRTLAPQNGSDVFYMLVPTFDVEVVVTKRPSNLSVDVQFGHDDGANGNVVGDRWRLRRAFLPWQSVHVRWNTQSDVH